MSLILAGAREGSRVPRLGRRRKHGGLAAPSCGRPPCSSPFARGRQRRPLVTGSQRSRAAAGDERAQPPGRGSDAAFAAWNHNRENVLDPSEGLVDEPGTDVGWLSGRERFVRQDVEIDAEAAEGLAAAYFRMDPTRRQQTLHIPLDRLDKASRKNDLADRSIDLGIAMEALVLHEL